MGVFNWFKRRVKSTPESRLAFHDLREASQPDSGYFIMTALSALIATFGLFLDSVAVIVGAMLIAPLMSPVLATGLGVARGDPKFLRGALESVAKGAVVAVVCAAAMAVISPELVPGREILSRTRPNLFDLAVAFASGIAGAYTFSSKDLSAALPGVAIAAALIPPLSVVGIGFGFGYHQIMWGALLLFGANLIAIAFGGAVTFIALGFYPKVKGAEGEWRLKSLIGTAVLLGLVTVPMVYFTFSNITTTSRQKNVGGVIEQYLPAREGYHVGAVEWVYRDGRYRVSALVYGKDEPAPDRLDFIRGALEDKLGKKTTLQVRYVAYDDLSTK
ncbi:MAG TPA: TIGR00341 family protein [bacterium]|nr:TIGR00341 family protein [bacterium]